jgi:hypothetical protein
MQTGPVEWQVSTLGGAVQVCNVDPLGREIAVVFCPPADDDRVAGEVVLLTAPGTPNAVAPVTTEMEDLVAGTVGISVLPNPSSELGDPLAYISFILVAFPLVLGAIVHFTGGIDFYVYQQGGQDRKEWGVGLKGKNLPESAELKCKHPATGTEISMKSRRKSPSDGMGADSSIQFTFPPGILDPTADSLEDVVLTWETTRDELLAVAGKGG